MAVFGISWAAALTNLHSPACFCQDRLGTTRSQQNELRNEVKALEAKLNKKNDDVLATRLQDQHVLCKSMCSGLTQRVGGMEWISILVHWGGPFVGEARAAVNTTSVCLCSPMHDQGFISPS